MLIVERSFCLREAHRKREQLWFFYSLSRLRESEKTRAFGFLSFTRPITRKRKNAGIRVPIIHAADYAKVKKREREGLIHSHSRLRESEKTRAFGSYHSRGRLRENEKTRAFGFLSFTRPITRKRKTRAFGFLSFTRPITRKQKSHPSGWLFCVDKGINLLRARRSTAR